MTKIKWVLITILICNFSIAQKVYNYSGIVKDKNTDLPLADALVIVKPLRTQGGGYYSGVRTKEDGTFDVTTNYRLPLNILVSRKGCASSSTKIKRINDDSFEIYVECEQETIDIIIEESKDNDNDGVINKDDGCPDIKGPADNNGCPLPDDDGDGVPNTTDECPSQKGPSENNGCPYPDGDQDGVPDHIDKCPDVKGVAEFEGCVDPRYDIQALLNENRFVFFKLDGIELSKEAIDFLNDLSTRLKNSENIAIEITGHASSEGSTTYNQELSEKRAQSVSDYLLNDGVKPAQLKTTGMGETQPMETNSTELGRSKNRRVEIKM